MNLFAFGDSITAFAGATSAAKAFISQLALALGLSLDNSGVSTAMCIDQGSALLSKAPVAGEVSTVWFGTNDQAKYDTDPAKRGFYIDCMRAYAVRLSTSPMLATPINGVTYSGSWGSSYAYGTYGASAPGSKATFSTTGNSVALGFIRQFNNSGTFRVRIDGTDKGVFPIGGDVRTLLGSSFGPMALTFSGLGAGNHNVSLEVVSADPQNVVFFQWFSAMQPKSKVIIGNVPHAIAYTYGGSAANVDAYNADLASLVASLSALDLDVSLADISSALSPSDFADNVHPNDSGHAKTYQAFYGAASGTTPPISITYSETKLYLGSDNKFYASRNGKLVVVPSM